MCDFVCNSMMVRWLNLWEVQSLGNSISQKFYEDETSRSRDIQVRRKSILIPIQNYFYAIPYLTRMACKVNNNYRALRGRDQRKKCTLNFIKYTLSRPIVLHRLQRGLYCTAKSALFVQ